jgi:hypothetical protein
VTFISEGDGEDGEEEEELDDDTCPECDGELNVNGGCEDPDCTMNSEEE